jgi:peptidoglycan hydrolase-like protein with peptidoglycan-binding domain
VILFTLIGVVRPSTVQAQESGTSVPNEVLNLNDSGPEVAQLQRDLVRLGCAPALQVSGPAAGQPFDDGYFGTATDEAVRKLQAAAGITQDGEAGADTKDAISRNVQCVAAPVPTTAAVATTPPATQATTAAPVATQSPTPTTDQPSSGSNGSVEQENFLKLYRPQIILGCLAVGVLLIWWIISRLRRRRSDY